MSIAVAEDRKSIAIAKASYSRAVANSLFSTAVAVQSDGLVILNHPGCVGVSYGSARVNAQGCTIILMPGSSSCPSEGLVWDAYYPSTGTLQGVEGTLVLVFDQRYLRWLSVTLQKGHKDYPSDKPLDIQWLVETIRRKAHENNPG